MSLATKSTKSSKSSGPSTSVKSSGPSKPATENPAVDPTDEDRPDGSPTPVGRPKRKVGGVAPFIEPRKRLSYQMRLNDWRRRGFVPLTPGRPKLYHRILPRTVIGISFMLLSAGIGAAFAGAAFYAYYDNRLAENETTVARFVENFDQQFSDASGALDQIRVQSVEEIRSELKPLGDFVADANGIIDLPQQVGESVWELQTGGEDGEPLTGAAFAVVGHQGGTAFVTSYSLVKASTQAPNPPILLVKDGRRLNAQLWSWDPSHDLALVVVSDSVPALDLATETDRVSAVGGRLFALSGTGGQGATASPGVLLDSSALGLQHTAAVGTIFQGGPLLTGEGKVMGVASLNYQPLGLDTGAVGFAPDIEAMCAVVLSCSQLRTQVSVDVTGDAADGAPAVEPETENDTDSETDAEADTDPGSDNDNEAGE